MVPARPKQRLFLSGKLDHQRHLLGVRLVGDIGESPGLACGICVFPDLSGGRLTAVLRAQDIEWGVASPERAAPANPCAASRACPAVPSAVPADCNACRASRGRPVPAALANRPAPLARSPAAVPASPLDVSAALPITSLASAAISPVRSAPSTRPSLSSPILDLPYNTGRDLHHLPRSHRPIDAERCAFDPRSAHDAMPRITSATESGRWVHTPARVSAVNAN